MTQRFQPVKGDNLTDLFPVALLYCELMIMIVLEDNSYIVITMQFHLKIEKKVYRL